MASKISMEVVIPEHQVILEASAVIAATATNISDRVVKGASSVNLPTLAEAVGESLAIGGTFTNEENNYGDDVLNLTQKAGRAFSINIFEEEQNVLNGIQDGLMGSLKAMAKQLDRDLIAKGIAAAGLTGTARTSDFYSDVVDMVKAFDDAKIPLENRYLAVIPADMSALLKTKDFVRFDAKGDGSAISTGLVGEILGFKVVRPLFTSAEGFSQSFAYHSAGLVYAWQGETKIQESELPLTSKTQYAVARLYNSKALQAGAFVKKWGVTP